MEYCSRVSCLGKIASLSQVCNVSRSERIALLGRIFSYDLQKPDLAGLAGFFKPLNEVILKANALTAGRRTEFFNHLKTVADALSALAWIAYTGKESGVTMFLVIPSTLEMKMCSFTRTF